HQASPSEGYHPQAGGQESNTGCRQKAAQNMRPITGRRIGGFAIGPVKNLHHFIVVLLRRLGRRSSKGRRNDLLLRRGRRRGCGRSRKVEGSSSRGPRLNRNVRR